MILFACCAFAAKRGTEKPGETTTDSEAITHTYLVYSPSKADAHAHVLNELESAFPAEEGWSDHLVQVDDIKDSAVDSNEEKTSLYMCSLFALRNSNVLIRTVIVDASTEQKARAMMQDALHESHSLQDEWTNHSVCVERISESGAARVREYLSART